MRSGSWRGKDQKQEIDKDQKNQPAVFSHIFPTKIITFLPTIDAKPGYAKIIL